MAIYVKIEPGFESVCGFDRKKVVRHKPHKKAKAHLCYKVDGDVAINRAYWNEVRREEQEKNREARCMVKSSKTGRLIRCEGKCEECAGFLNGDIVKEENRPASTEFIAENGVEAMFGKQGNPNLNSPLVTSMEDAVVDQLMLEGLVEKAATISPQHGEIFKLMLDGLTQQAIADELGMKQRTVSNKIAAIRTLLKPLVKEILS